MSPHPTALACCLALALALAACAAPSERMNADKRQALAEFSEAYGIAAMWPRFAAKAARDSMPRLRAAAGADLASDALDRPARARAEARLDALVPAARQELETALRALDADELAAFTAYEVYGKYFETDEIRAMTRFFGSATGRKMAAESPAILAETRDPAGSTGVMARHFTEAELREIAAFWQSPVGRKMGGTAPEVREDIHRHFLERTEPAVQELARRLATRAEDEEAGDALPTDRR